MITNILIASLSICVILLSREILKLKKRLNVLHNESNNRIVVVEQKLHLRMNDEYNELLGIIKSNASNGDDIREQRLKELKDEIQKLIPPTNQELMDRIETMETESYRLRMNM